LKPTPFEADPPAVTTTFPLVAPFGTVTQMPVELQLVTWAGVPLKVTVLAPWLLPKLFPLIITAELTRPEYGDRLVIEGSAAVVKDHIAEFGDDPPLFLATTFHQY
jgi:hypothetical protein